MKTTIIFFVLFFTTPLFAVTLKPENTEQFFVTPNTKTVLRFQINGEEKTETVKFQLSGAETKNISIKPDGKTVAVTVNLSCGFWELESGTQRFGIVSLPEFKGKPDKFFAIDAALSWLVSDEQIRNGLVKSAKRNGIAMIRERLSWNDIEPKPEQFHWKTGRYDSVRKLCKEQGIEILEVFHETPNWMEKVEKYPSDLVKTAKSWNTIANYWNTGSGIPQYRIVWFDGVQWHHQQVSQRVTPFHMAGHGTMCPPISRPKLLTQLLKNGKTRIWHIFRDVERGHRISVAYCDNIEEGRWICEDLTDFEVRDWEPCYDTQLWRERKKLHLYVQKVGQGNYETPVDIDPQMIYVMEVI
jgi:hypothetical protein